MALTDSEMEVLRRLAAAEDDGRHVPQTFDEAVEELGLDRFWVALNLSTAGAVVATGTARQGGAMNADVTSVTPPGREMAPKTRGGASNRHESP